MRLGKLVMVALIGVIVMPMTAAADYVVVGPIRGQECTSYLLFETCEMHSVDAVLGDDDKLHTLQRRYEAVSSHRVESDGTERCWIKLKARGQGLISGAINAVKRPYSPMFYTKTTGKYDPIDVESLTFKCRKR